MPGAPFVREKVVGLWPVVDGLGYVHVRNFLIRILPTHVQFLIRTRLVELAGKRLILKVKQQKYLCDTAWFLIKSKSYLKSSAT